MGAFFDAGKEAVWRRRRTPRTRKVNVARIVRVPSWCADSTNNAVISARKEGDMKTCSKPGCDRAHSAKGLCKTHYTMRQKTLNTKPCGVEGCGDTVWVRGWCVAHYEQWRRGLTPGERSLQKERLNVEPFLGRINHLCNEHTITETANNLRVDPATVYRWRRGAQLTISPEQVDRLEMLTWAERNDTSDVMDFAKTAEGKAMIEQMRKAA